MFHRLAALHACETPQMPVRQRTGAATHRSIRPMPSVDVLVPNYQYGRFLRQSVSSILDQGIDDLRILIIDNASTDDSVQIARELAASDARIELRARPVNLGMHASLNEGVDWAAADYFTVVCSDDLLPPGALRRAVSI